MKKQPKVGVLLCRDGKIGIVTNKYKEKSVFLKKNMKKVGKKFAKVRKKQYLCIVKRNKQRI